MLRAVIFDFNGVINPSSDRVKVDGRLLPPISSHDYYLFHKPAGLITSMVDPDGRRTVGDWIRTLRKGKRLFPVGRLDANTSGLLLLTNHGDLTYRLSHPRFEVTKVYEVKVAGIPSEEELERLRKGIALGGRKTAPARVKVFKRLKKKTWLEVEIHEGKYREVRRMFEGSGHFVEKLVRTRLGPIQLGSLPPGDIRPLSHREIAALHRVVGMATKDFTGSGPAQRATRGNPR